MEAPPELRALSDLAHAAAHGKYEVEELLRRICTSVAETFGFDRAAITRYLPETGEIVAVAAHGFAIDAPSAPRQRVEEWPLFERALEAGRGVFVEDVRQDPVLPPPIAEAFGVRSVLALPLMSVGRCLGFLAADRGGKEFRLGEQALALLDTTASVAAVFLEKALEQDELRRLNELARNFIALAAHELRTPAAVVHGIGATLHLRGDELRHDQLQALRHTLYEQTDRLTRLVDQLLDLSRLEASAIRIRPEPLRIRDRVEELVLMTTGERAREVEIDVPPELEVTADPNAFDRIVSNLIANALRYGEPPVRVAADQRDRHFRLSVEDRGPGVEPDFVPRLFERFTRSEESREGAAGAGLGLAIAHSYAQAHGGELLYESGEPSGARFELVLPRTHA